MKPEVLIVGPMMPHVMAALDAVYATHRLWEAEDPEALLDEVGPRIRGLATRGDLGADAALIGRLTALEVISCFGVGVDGIDLEAARARGIPVGNTPDVLTDDVANLAIALMLAVSRDLVRSDAYVRDGSWESAGGYPLTRALRGKTAGILGLGRIGADIARKAEAFGMAIAYHGPRRKAGVAYAYHDSVTGLADAADYLVVACPGGEATKHIVNAEVLRALGPEGTLINISRGTCVDEAALVEALESGLVGWAGLDVFEHEPHVPAALKQSGRVVLQPHAGSATEETRRAMGDLVVENLARHFAGKPLATPVA